MISPIISTNPKIMSDEIQRLKDQDVSTGKSIDALRSVSAKNINSYPYYQTTRTTNGITFTDIGDGSIKANGTATAGASFTAHSRVTTNARPLIIPNGKYRISGCPSGGSTTTYRISVVVTKGGTAFRLGEDTGEGVIVDVNGDDNYTDKACLQLGLDIGKGTTMTNAMFYPMVECLELAKPDTSFVPYTYSNSQLTKKMKTLECNETTAGTYKLEATVDSSGDVSYEWVEVV